MTPRAGASNSLAQRARAIPLIPIRDLCTALDLDCNFVTNHEISFGSGARAPELQRLAEFSITQISTKFAGDREKVESRVKQVCIVCEVFAIRLDEHALADASRTEGVKI